MWMAYGEGWMRGDGEWRRGRGVVGMSGLEGVGTWIEGEERGTRRGV